jgi:Cu(I)/Ag(I) efflux system membrane protein CusA/SilA
MIEQVIRWSISNRMLVLLAAVCVAAWGVWALSTTPVDALPDLSDVQVIIRTSYPGQAPQIVENQVTYPLTTTMLSVPGAKTVIRSLVILLCMCCLKMAPICIGRDRVCSNI